MKVGVSIFKEIILLKLYFYFIHCMMYKLFFFKMAVVILLLSNGAISNAQETIGTNTAPEFFSVLELVSNKTHNLQKSQHATIQRKAFGSETANLNLLKK